MSDYSRFVPPEFQPRPAVPDKGRAKFDFAPKITFAAAPCSGTPGSTPSATGRSAGWRVTSHRPGTSHGAGREPRRSVPPGEHTPPGRRRSTARRKCARAGGRAARPAPRPTRPPPPAPSRRLLAGGRTAERLRHRRPGGVQDGWMDRWNLAPSWRMLPAATCCPSSWQAPSQPFCVCACPPALRLRFAPTAPRGARTSCPCPPSRRPTSPPRPTGRPGGPSGRVLPAGARAFVAEVTDIRV